MKYTTDRQLGQGSFGIVYEAHDSAGNRYAVKTVKSGDRLRTELLRKQFDFLSSLDHKRIVKVMDFDVEGPMGPMMVTEMVDGVDLNTYVEEHGTEHLPLITAKVLDGLRYLHGLGRVHGDVKPDSILIYEENGRPEIKLIDAGLDVGEGNRLPMLAGTPSYMAPEIIRNLAADGRSDLYSLGVTLYEVLTGETPFAGKDQEESCRKHLEYQPPPPSRVNPRLGSVWDGFIAKLIEKEPLLRYKDADQAGLELEKISGSAGLYLDQLMPPRRTPLVARQEEIDRATACLMPPSGKGVLMYGEQGCGIGRILERIGSLAKLKGRNVFAVTLNEEMPAVVQVVEGVLGPQAEALEAETTPAAGVSVDDSACFREVLDSFQSRLPPDREHLLIIDGGEAMEPHELILLGALAAEMRGRMGVIIGYQSQKDGVWRRPGSDSFITIEVPPLNAEEVERAVSLYFGTRALPSELTEEIFHATGGNPGLMELTLDHLWSSESLSFVRNKGALQMEWDGRVEVPTSVKGVIREKLANLSVFAIDVLKVVFSGGGRIETELLSEWLEPGRLYAALQELAGIGLIDRTGGWTRLVMGKESLGEALLPKMGADEMERISLQMAEILESRIKGAYDYYRLGLLYLQGGRDQDAFRNLTGAGERFARFSIRDALLAYRKSLDCSVESKLSSSIYEKIGDLKLEQGDLESAAGHFAKAASIRPSSLRKLGWVTGLRGEFEESVGILKQSEQSALENANEIDAARAQSDLGYIYAMQSRRDLSLGVLEKARKVFEDHAMHLEAGQASNRIAFMEWKVGDFKRAAGAWVTARKYFDQAGDGKRAAVCLMSLGLCHRKEMDFAGAEKCFKRALSIFTQIRAIGEKASCQQNYALLLLDQGYLQHASDLTEEALAVSNLLGRHSAIVTCTILLGVLSLEVGNWQEAEASLLSLLEYRPPPDVFQEAMIKRYLALAAGMAGRFSQAEELVDESFELACDAQDGEGLGQALLAKSMIMLRMGNHRRAAETAREALAALGRSSSMFLANEAHRVTGEASCLAGNHKGGISALLTAKGGFEVAPQSLHMARVLRALALGYFAEGDHNSSKSYLRKSADISRSAGARYDYALALLLGGKHAIASVNFVRARHYLLEAARILGALKIGDLYEEAVNEMEKVPSSELEVGAVSSLSKISQTLNSSHDLTTVLNLAMDLAIEYLGAERGVIMLQDEATGDLATFAQRAMDNESLEEVISISRSIVESVRKTKESVIASDATQDPRFKHSRSVKTHNIMSVMCVPLSMGDKFLGIIYLDSRDVSSGFSDLETAFVGAFANQVSLAIENARLVGKLYDDMADLRVQAAEKYSFDNVIGPGKRMQEVFRKVDKAARSDLRILITGENGTGKQVIANLVHRLSDRKNKPMIQVNCAAIAKDLLEAELFGIEKHVATGVSPRSGYFERAHGSTIFLDEIGDMPATTQMKVLRVLSEHEFERVGGSKIIEVDVRVISATNKDLRALVEKGRFRKDLYYRLNHMRIHIPPLRERREDLPCLIDHFLAKYVAANSKPHLTISRGAVGLLRQYWWPGNVRELETCIQHAVVKADGTEILPEHLHDEILENLRSRDPNIQFETNHEPLPEAVRKLEKRMIERALKESGGIKTVAAGWLGIHESTLRKKIKNLGIANSNRHQGL